MSTARKAGIGGGGREDAGASEIIDRLKKAVSAENDAELARLLGVSRTTLSNWRARNSVPMARLRPLCKEFAVPLDYLFSGRVGIDKLIVPPLDSELLGYVFRMLDRYGFIKLPKARSGFDPARRAAAEFVLLQNQATDLMQQLTSGKRMTGEQAKRAVLTRLSKMQST